MKTTINILELSILDNVPLQEEIEIATGVYCAIRSLTDEQQEFIDQFIQQGLDDLK